MSDVINFPPVKFETMADVRASIQEIRRYKSDELADVAMEEFFVICSTAGVDFDEEKFDKDLALVLQAFLSVLYKKYGIPHPLQVLAERSFAVTSGEVGFISEGEPAVASDRLQPDNPFESGRSA